MATLTRPKNVTQAIASPSLVSAVPTPFPREQLVAVDVEEPITELEVENPFEPEAGPSSLVETGTETPNTLTLKEVMPSIAHVQKSCLMTLNNLLAEPIGWNPIVPERRHSMPSSPAVTSAEESSSSTPALQTLVANLRNREPNEEMIEAKANAADADLLRELRTRVDSISTSLSDTDASLAKALVDLVTNLTRLSVIQSNMTYLPSRIIHNDDTASILEAPPPIDLFDTLSRQLSDLQIERLSSQIGPSASTFTSPVLAVETALLWSRIDTDLDHVVAMCKQRVETLPKFTQEHLPPQYDLQDYDDRDLESLPDYEPGGRSSFDDSKSTKAGASQQHQQQTQRHGDEKMRMDLEAVAMAIDRLYLVAPQLHNQRVELKSSKVAELQKLEKAKAAEAIRSVGKGKEKVKDVKDLEKIVAMIGRASERTIKDQSVILDGGMQSRLDRVKKKDSAKRDAFVEQLMRHSEAGRLHNQDAVLQMKDPEALLTLPEFMREAVPTSQKMKDGEALLTLPEFVKEPPPAHLSSELDEDFALPEEEEDKADSKQKKRNRSSSAPPLSWLRASASRAANGVSSTSGHTRTDSKGKGKAPSQGFDVVYVAENHESLHHILVFFTFTGGKPGAEIQAEVTPPLLSLPADGTDHLVIKSGPHVSLPLLLPAHTAAGKQEVRAQSGHYEIKLMTPRTPSSSTHSSPPTSSDGHGSDRTDSPSTPLLDASQLLSIKPTSFICSSCSLPLILSSRVESYRDLPSEHWEELVEAWMCHGDQKLDDEVAKRGKDGFWPARGEALVGGSYVLFEEGAMNKPNLFIGAESKHGDNWRLARCLCGAIIGRCQERTLHQGLTTVYRVLKYAVRPVSPNAEPLKVPLSAFIVEDMMEFVQAHASYRFVIKDEEEEKPRILIWLFKPRIRLAYTTPRHHAIPKSGNILAAKVLYKLLAPAEASGEIKSILDKYPGFPQAEYLSYPMSVCRNVAALLNDSNSAYPERLRTMTGLKVGWLQRV